MNSIGGRAVFIPKMPDVPRNPPANSHLHLNGYNCAIWPPLAAREVGKYQWFFFFSKLSSLKKSFLQQECYWSGTHPHTAMTSLGSTSDGKIFVGESCLEHVKVDMAVTPMS